MSTDLLSLALCTIPFWPAVFIGLYLCANAHEPMGRMAGLLTLKPLVTTPIWLAILSSQLSPSVLRTALSILPGLGLTLAAFFAFRSLFSGRHAGAAWSLLVLDCLRWLNSAVLGLLNAGMDYSPTLGSITCLVSLIGLMLPTMFSVIALATVLAPSVGNGRR
jgi:hypothetical protein